MQTEVSKSSKVKGNLKGLGTLKKDALKKYPFASCPDVNCTIFGYWEPTVATK